MPSVQYAWPGGVIVSALDSRLKRSRVRLAAVSFSGDNLRQVVHTHTHAALSPTSIGLIGYRSKGGDALRLGR